MVPSSNLDQTLTVLVPEQVLLSEDTKENSMILVSDGCVATTRPVGEVFAAAAQQSVEAGLAGNLFQGLWVSGKQNMDVEAATSYGGGGSP